jgi:hypothetical protein
MVSFIVVLALVASVAMPIQVSIPLYTYGLACLPGPIVYFVAMSYGWILKWRKKLMITAWAQVGATGIISIYLSYFAAHASPMGAIDIVAILANLALNVWGAVICTIFWYREQTWDHEDH